MQVGEGAALQDDAIEAVRSGSFTLRTPSLGRIGSGSTGCAAGVDAAPRGAAGGSAGHLGDDGRGEVRFEVTPTEVGRFVWEVSIPVAGNDHDNNRFPVVVRVVRDRTRVLQVCGSPSTDQKFCGSS